MCFEHGSVRSRSGFKAQPMRALAGSLACWRVNLIWASHFFQFSSSQSALLFTEVLKEREAQLELKRLKEKAAEGRDQQYLDQMQRELEESELKENCQKVNDATQSLP